MRRTGISFLVVLALASSLPGPRAVSAAPGSSQWPCPNWGMYGRTVQRTFEQECPSPITKSSVSTLVPAWFFKTPKTVTASPAVVGRTLYVGDWSGTMFALDTASGAERWHFQAAAAPGATYGPIVSSAALASVDGRPLVIFGAGPRVYALDARSGKAVWTRYVGALGPNGKPLLKGDPVEVESSPAVWRGRVYVGIDTHDQGVDRTRGINGGLLALDVATGRRLWKFEPDNGAGCGGVWSSPAVDTQRGLVYFGSANCTDGPKAWTRYVESVTALDARLGTPVWSFQPHKPNRDDTDFGATPNLFVDPAGRDVLGIGNKDGFYYALNRSTGKVRWKTKVAEPGNVSEDFAIGGFIGSSGISDGRVYGTTAIGGPPYFHAIDGETGNVMWSGVQAPGYGASASVHGVVFTAALDNVVRALDSDTGRVLWSAPLAGPSSSGPAIVGDSVYVGSGTSSSDACQKDQPGGDVCAAFFDQALGQTGGVHAFRLLSPASTNGVESRLFSPQGNQLDVYDLSQDPPTWHPFIPQYARGGRDLNGQVCRIGKDFALMGEDSRQDKGIPQGWGIFDLRSKREVGKLIATYPKTTTTPEPYGCLVEPKTGRIFVTQVGTGDFQQPDGQLMVFFPSSPALDAVYGRRAADEVCPKGDCFALTRRSSQFCIIDNHVRTAGALAMDRKGNVYLPEFAPTIPPDVPAPGRVLRYRGPFPTSSENCFARKPQTFIQDPAAATPGAIVAARNSRGNPTGTWYVSSVIFPSVVNEYDASGAFIRDVLSPGFATPFGLAVGKDGTLYVADLGVNFDPTRIPNSPDRFGIDTQDGEGSVLRVRFANGLPQPPEYLKTGLDFPDGLGLIE